MKDLADWSALSGDDFADQLHQAIRDAPRVLPQVAAPTAGFDFRWTDLGNAQRLNHRMGDHLTWNEQYGHMVYSDGAYDRDEGRRRYTEWGRETEARIAEGLALVTEGERTGNTTLVEHGEAMVGYFTGCQSKYKQDACVELTKSLAFVPRDQFDANVDLLVCSNGTLDLASGLLRDHSPTDLMTHRLSVPYDANAQAPLWQQCWEDWFPDNPEIRRFFQTYLGYCLTGRVDLQTVLMSIGDGGTGKSTCHNVVHKLLEPICWSANWQTFEKRQSGSGTSDLAATAFSRILLAAESDMGVRMSESILKRASGGDAMTAAFKYQAEFNFFPKFKVLLVTNHFPVFNDPSDGLWRRLITVMWTTKQTDRRDLTMESRLLREKPGILAWLVEGCRTYMDEGLVIPEVITEWTQQFRETSDVLGEFVDNHLIVDPDAVTLGQSIFDRYRAWAEDNGIRWMRDRSLYSALTERLGIEKRRRGRGGVHLYGVRLMTSAERVGDAGDGAQIAASPTEKSVTSTDEPKTPEVTQVTHDPETPLVVIGSTTESFGKTASLATPATPPQVRGTKSGDAEVTQVTLGFEEFGE